MIAHSNLFSRTTASKLGSQVVMHPLLDGFSFGEWLGRAPEPSGGACSGSADSSRLTTEGGSKRRRLRKGPRICRRYKNLPKIGQPSRDTEGFVTIGTRMPRL